MAPIRNLPFKNVIVSVKYHAMLEMQWSILNQYLESTLSLGYLGLAFDL